ncbi:hypothetical protein CAPTEDRAFT_18659 [Capitella teleta]|uniref:Low molecular weight phosphotyrosine protein phosphatase n=1 Tax=Capitella teleta TaxID=283909 RepID=R7TDA5_CAPTE|nr:hypothetical protein CAPTEDRAFT_18659 [Capitella teleta]|eukprot:ELT91477.1 hypothetical protein CAPTEDRAFT_18659 [Capitella teleta]
MATGRNICRSPIAEAVFKKLVNDRGLNHKWLIDSAATENWHTGSLPDDRAMECLKKHGVTTDHRVRKINKDDYRKFDVIFGMDEDNMSDLERMAPKGATTSLKRLGEYDPKKELTIQDPYYGGDEGFEIVYQQCVRCCNGFLDAQ